MINARAETLAEQARLPRRAAHAPLPDRRRRLLRVADSDADGAQAAVLDHARRRRAVRLRRPVGDLARRRTDEPLRSCTIITTDANARSRDIHDRMPVILPDQDAEEAWLRPRHAARALAASCCVRCPTS